MLRQRVITALILAVALITALFFTPSPVPALLFAVVAAGFSSAQDFGVILLIAITPRHKHSTLTVVLHQFASEG